MSSIILALVGFLCQTYAQSPHGDALKLDCAACHDASGWLPVRDTLHFDHNVSNFPLTGSHQLVDCKSCHTSLVFGNASTQCVDCHTDIHSMTVGNDCARCHTQQSWIVDNIPEIHEQNGFSLVGSHGSPSCVECHISETSLKFNPIGNDCINCHREDYAATNNPDHQKLGFSADCVECHDPASLGWTAGLVEHDFFPLTMGHNIADCKQCHLTENYADASPECVSCHLDNYTATTNPDHAHAGFSNNCAECHTTGGWSPSSFDHNIVYPLIGAHEAVANNCALCHVDGYSNTPNTCVGCHLDDYTATTDPNHADAKFPQDCAQCHDEKAWAPSSFDHNTVHPLLGAHSAIANNCMLCHANGYANTPNTCVGCHLDDYTATTNPDHVDAKFPQDCAQCHDEKAWTPADFNHNSIYPLLGAHAAVANDCARCHAQGYANTPNTCVGCHLDDYNASANPNHTDANFPKDCVQCHDETAWIPADFNHNSIYPLTGAHAPIANDCARCHAQGYTNTPNTCVGCHLDDYRATTNPNHADANFPKDCVQCHDETAWIPADFNHNSIYPLTGAHAPIANDCARCHAQGYTNTPNTCVGCHLDDYNGTSKPNHSSALFPKDCTQC
ncbi:MAG: hypothetical protein OEV74_17795, partial [Cyclobacteriaceae bacterium]|nr:hypothetical protein [Cyclobacteriaceae bacterium]